MPLASMLNHRGRHRLHGMGHVIVVAVDGGDVPTAAELGDCESHGSALLQIGAVLRS